MTTPVGIFCDPAKHTDLEKGVVRDLRAAFEASALPLEKRLQAFPRHTRRQDIARFLTRYELFKLNLPAHGSVVECGVLAGAGLISWLHFSSILEPYNHTRQVIGFDTFTGFPTLHAADTHSGKSEHLSVGGLATSGGMQ